MGERVNGLKYSYTVYTGVYTDINGIKYSYTVGNPTFNLLIKKLIAEKAYKRGATARNDYLNLGGVGNLQNRRIAQGRAAGFGEGPDQCLCKIKKNFPTENAQKQLRKIRK